MRVRAVFFEFLTVHWGFRERFLEGRRCWFFHVPLFGHRHLVAELAFGGM